jgi:hypothetical protein
MDMSPVSNREFLAFVHTHPQWAKGHLAEALHDGSYLREWANEEGIVPTDLDQPVHFVSFFAAQAFCQSQGKTIPTLRQYRVATHTPVSEAVTISYQTFYQAPDLHLVQSEWTVSPWANGPAAGRVAFRSGLANNNVPGSQGYSPELDKRSTAPTLGFRCVAPS